MFLLAIRKKVGVTSTIVGKAVAKALIAKSDDASLKAVYIDGSFWAKRLFRRMGGGGVAKGASATRKVEIPDGARKEARYFFIMKL